MAERYYVNYPLQPGLAVLQGAEAHHLAVVCRLRPGQLVYLFNGDGREYPAEIVAADRRHVELQVLGIEFPNRELPFQLKVAAPLPKGDRAHFLIEKLTELGVTAFIPLRTRRSVVHPSEGRTEKLQRYVIEACKQCGRNQLMRIEELWDWDKFARSDHLPARKLLAHAGGNPFPPSLPSQDTVLAIGPEGGITEEEVVSARQGGWTITDLGPRILRVETAALVLAALVGIKPSSA
jgi:16S rRNA (uracil1498-N3)-methyltransferase